MRKPGEPYNPFVDQAVLRIKEREAKARPVFLVPQDSKQIRGEREISRSQRRRIAVQTRAASAVAPPAECTLQELLPFAVEQGWLFSTFRIQARKLGARDEEIKRLWLTRPG